MDNFRKRPSHSSARQPIAGGMDGFVSSDRFKGQGSISFRRHEDSLPPVNPTPEKPVDDLRRPEGFQPAAQPVIQPTPIIMRPSPIGNPVPKERRFGRQRGRPLSTGIRPKRRWWKVAKRSLIGVGTVAFCAALFFAIKIYVIQRHVFRGGGSAPALAQTIDISRLKGEGDGRVNILLLGIGGPGHDGPDLTDTILLVSIDPVNNQASLLSIPRDLWVKIPGNGSQKINAAFAYGKQNSKAKDQAGKTRDGLKLLDQTLSPVIGIPIHYHAVVDFAAFKQAVDAVGGVTFNVPEQLYDPTIAWENHNNPVIAAKGNQSFNGAKALLYARSRETSSDFARGERQRLLMVALKEKILSLGTFSNPLKVSQLLDSLGNNVYTDFGSGDLNRIYQIAGQIPSASIVSLDLVTPPHSLVTTAPINGLSTVVPKAGLNNYDEITSYIRNALKDGFIQQENAKIAILNGTDTTGLATLKSKELKSFGYNVTTVGDAPTKDYTRTVLVDVHNTKKYTKHYLEQRLGVAATSTLPAGINAGDADFVILVGSDAKTSQN